MTERQIIERQEQSGNKQLLLVLIGGFYHAYESAAYALGRATGYKVVRKHRKMGDIVTCGFAASRISQVCQRLREAGAEVEQEDDRLWLFCGIDPTPDESMVCQEQSKNKVTMSVVKPLHSPLSLVEEVLNFPLSQSTPMDAMMFISRLQQQLRQQHESQTV